MQPKRDRNDEGKGCDVSTPWIKGKTREMPVSLYCKSSERPILSKEIELRGWFDCCSSCCLGGDGGARKKRALMAKIFSQNPSSALA